MTQTRTHWHALQKPKIKRNALIKHKLFEKRAARLSYTFCGTGRSVRWLEETALSALLLTKWDDKYWHANN